MAGLPAAGWRQSRLMQAALKGAMHYTRCGKIRSKRHEVRVVRVVEPAAAEPLGGQDVVQVQRLRVGRQIDLTVIMADRRESVSLIAARCMRRDGVQGMRLHDAHGAREAGAQDLVQVPRLRP